MKDDELRFADPLANLELWYEQARAAELTQPEAVGLATATADGVPSARMVLFRGFSEGRLVFFTDYRSRKAAELDSNPRAALLFYWKPLARQVRVEGAVERLDGAASDRYFLSRGRGSRISAWASTQSAEIERRELLEQRRAEVEQRFKDREVTRPEQWGGYALQPQRVEFWREREHRFHDRTLFRRSGERWSRTILQP